MNDGTRPLEASENVHGFEVMEAFDGRVQSRCRAK